jgi:L-fucose mutarotase
MFDKLGLAKREKMMLKTLDPLLNADVLHAFRSMGHGDDLIICDTNFPADSVARDSVYGKLLRIDGTCARVTRAVLSQFPLDTFVDHPALRMEVVGEPLKLLDVHKEVQVEIDRAENSKFKLGTIERFAFYERAKKAYCVIQSAERRFYGCFVFKMGVVSPDAKLD